MVQGASIGIVFGIDLLVFKRPPKPLDFGKRDDHIQRCVRGNDVDDVLVLLHSFVQESKANSGVELVNKGNRLAPAFTDLVNHFCGRTDVDIGWCSTGPAPREGWSSSEEGRYLRPVLEAGKGFLPYDPDRKAWPDAVSQLRGHLSSIPEQGGICGFSRNILYTTEK